MHTALAESIRDFICPSSSPLWETTEDGVLPSLAFVLDPLLKRDDIVLTLPSGNRVVSADEISNLLKASLGVETTPGADFVQRFLNSKEFFYRSHVSSTTFFSTKELSDVDLYILSLRRGCPPALIADLDGTLVDRKKEGWEERLADVIERVLLCGTDFIILTGADNTFRMNIQPVLDRVADIKSSVRPAGRLFLGLSNGALCTSVNEHGEKIFYSYSIPRSWINPLVSAIEDVLLEFREQIDFEERQRKIEPFSDLYRKQSFLNALSAFLDNKDDREELIAWYKHLIAEREKDYPKLLSRLGLPPDLSQGRSDIFFEISKLATMIPLKNIENSTKIMADICRSLESTAYSALTEAGVIDPENQSPIKVVFSSGKNFQIMANFADHLQKKSTTSLDPKANALLKLIRLRGYSIEHCIALGDSAGNGNDGDFLRLVPHSFSTMNVLGENEPAFLSTEEQGISGPEVFTRLIKTLFPLSYRRQKTLRRHLTRHNTVFP